MSLSAAAVKIIEKNLEADGVIPVGTHHVDMTVTLHVKGDVKKGADCMVKSTVNIPLKATMALFLSKMGFMRDQASEMLLEAMTEALALGDDAEEKIKDKLADVNVAMARVSALVGSLPLKPKSGATTISKDAIVEVIAVVGGPVSDAA